MSVFPKKEAAKVGTVKGSSGIPLMDGILQHLWALNYCDSQDCRDLRWCKISSINSM